jgi:hypothetical protein
MRAVFGIWRNPLFRYELTRAQHRAWRVSLLVLNTLYLLTFLTCRFRWGLAAVSASGGGSTLTAEFPYLPWLLAGGALLSLSAHWLIPPFLLGVLGRSYDLRPLELMVRHRFNRREALRGQIGGSLASLVLGSLPLALLVPLLLVTGPRFLPMVATGLLLAVLWGALSAGATFWAGVACRSRARAYLGSYLLTSLVLPLTLGVVAAAVGLGCSAGRRDAASVFLIATVLTWCLLATGLAATFWDATYGRLFPETRQPLWLEPERTQSWSLEN